MKSTLKSRICFALLAFCAIAPSLAQPDPAGEEKKKILAAGYKAGMMCSAVFIAGRDPADVLREELGGGNPIMKVEHNDDPVVAYKTRSVTCSAGEGLPTRLAVHREGYGTVLLPPGATLDDVVKLPQVRMSFPKGDPAKIA
ncbi:MAG: hypothetical protein GY953_59015, partial [bacterium]|nr:hypothetical protein [bacterium]